MSSRSFSCTSGWSMTLITAGTAAAGLAFDPLAPGAASTAGSGLVWPFVPLAFAIGFFSSGTAAVLDLLAGAVAFFSGFLGSRVFPVANLVVFGETDFGEFLGIPDEEGTTPLRG